MLLPDTPDSKASAAPAASSGIELVRDADVLIETFIPMPTPNPAPPPYETILLPFCTPQLASSFDSPFARGYNPTLEASVGISQDQLLAFIDGLNLAMTASPPLRVVDFAGKIIGMVPFHWAMIAGIAMQTAAQTGMHVLSKTLSDRYLRAANLRLFRPRGLSVRICSTAAMQHLVMRAGNGAGPSTIDKIGRGVGTLLLHVPLPLSSRIVRSIADRPPKISPSISAVGDGRRLPLATQRRLASLEGYTLPLNLDVPPPAKPQGAMDTIASWGVKYDTYRAGRKENKTEARRSELDRINSLLAAQRNGMPYYASPQMAGPSMGGPSMEPVGWYDRKTMRKAARRERKDLRQAVRRESRRDRGRNGLLSGLIGSKETQLERRVANSELLESWTTDKVLWIVIMSAEFDKEIDGIERADGLDDEEHVDPGTWTAELTRERDILEEEEDEESESEQEGNDGKKFGRSKEAPY
ncbi:hypothetical protein FB45DRAFT_896529 [Roridomyces roridus]|uniref:Uncharacterized protein n=1 Tax=Roridomyces roridus TaxID=1738132 RepID=A0AAD7CAX0_9AGAR|nr:hypothetical protein FB45DRAFT_896529 [Roridomyces roridus]